MLPLTQEWIDKAEGDWGSMEREGQMQNAPNYDLVCFLAQQCAEKYLKARLQEAGLAFPKTHNLPALFALVLPIEPAWSILQTALTKLDDYSVDFRCPGNNANSGDAQAARQFCRNVREVVRRSMGLPV